MANFTERLKACRKEQKRTQKQVAEAIGTSEQNYQRYERGTQQPTLPVLLSLADYFDVPLDYLTGRGIFYNWEDIVKNKDYILDALEQEISGYDLPIPAPEFMKLLKSDDRMLMTILPAIVLCIYIHDKEIEITLR